MTVDSTLTICSACRVRRRWTAYQCREGEMAACMHACMCRVRYWFARLLLTWPLLALDYNYSWRYCMRVNFDCYPDPDIVPYNFLSRHTTHMPHHAHAPSCPITHMTHYTHSITHTLSIASDVALDVKLIAVGTPRYMQSLHHCRLRVVHGRGW